MDATVAVQSVDSVGPDTVAVTLASPEAFDGKPGQFVKLTAVVDGEEVSRFYTISSPDTDGSFETTVGLDGGDFAQYLADLTAGDELDMGGPFGDDYYRGESRAVIFAGGPGVGPAVAIAEAALAAGNEAAVVYQDDEPAHTERLDDLRERGASVVVTDGDIADAVAGAVTGEEGEQVFVYGFADFVDAATAAVDTTDYAGEVKVENFG